jgi:very-long-chain (3R)-3-hydroxyacyl-CoA dehydratase
LAQELGIMPYPLLWLRYSTFVILYPLGVASEMTMVYLAMPVIRKERPLSFSMPNSFNFAFDYYVFCWIAIACYVPGLPELYFHMLRQRKKILGPAPKAAKKMA